MFGLEFYDFFSNLNNELEKLEFIKLIQKWITDSCECTWYPDTETQLQGGVFCSYANDICMKFLVNYFNFWKKADYYISDNDLEVQYFPDKKFQKGWVRIIPRKEKILLDEVKSKQILEKQIGINDIYFSFKRAKNIIEMNGAVFLLWRDFCEPKQTAIGGYKTENFNFAILKRRINAFVRHNSPKDTKDHELDGKWSTMKPMEKKQELKELFYGCLLALILIE